MSVYSHLGTTGATLHSASFSGSATFVDSNSDQDTQSLEDQFGGTNVALVGATTGINGAAASLGPDPNDQGKNQDYTIGGGGVVAVIGQNLRKNPTSTMARIMGRIPGPLHSKLAVARRAGGHHMRVEGSALAAEYLARHPGPAASTTVAAKEQAREHKPVAGNRPDPGKNLRLAAVPAAPVIPGKPS
jgi:hypothetical protein